MVPGPAGLRGALSHVESAQDTPVCPLFESRVPVQADPEDRGPDPPPARLGAVPAHQEHRAGPDPPGESGEEEGGGDHSLTHSLSTSHHIRSEDKMDQLKHIGHYALFR